MTDHVAVLKRIRNWVSVDPAAKYRKDDLAALDHAIATCEADAEIREILFSELDRDRDNTTTRGLVVVAVNSLYWRKKELAAAKEGK